jgi:hypothetical protein
MIPTSLIALGSFAQQHCQNREGGGIVADGSAQKGHDWHTLEQWPIVLGEIGGAQQRAGMSASRAVSSTGF